MGYFLIIPILLCFIIFYNLFRNKNGLPTNWPFVGMIPSLLKNLHRLNDFIIEVMEISNFSFSFNGPWFSDMNYVVTVDPSNVNHVYSKKFKYYLKGKKLNEILELLGNGILNTDDALWLYHRNVGLSFFNQPNFPQFLVNITIKKLDNGLIPILNQASIHKNVIDMQELFLRFMYDTICIIMMDHDLMSLSIDLPNFPLLSSLDTIEHMIVYRHVVPTFVWKSLRWLNIGYERKVKIAIEMLDNLIYKCIDMKREERKNKGINSKFEENYTKDVSADLLTFFMDQDEHNNAPIIHNNEKFLRDSIVNFFLAGAMTTSSALTWFFCLVSKNPRVLQNLREELQQVINNIENIASNFNEMNNKLIYLHATICEALRLYPSLVFNHKAAIESDILPSGHKVKKNTTILFNMYAMGRNKLIWGEDWKEFKPERWITQDGMIKHEPSYKFAAFGAGPRSCLGKQMTLTQIKIIAIIVIQNYEFEAVQKHHVPEVALLLRMKNGFKVKVSKT